ncbi:hypothetical protein AB8O64_05115 [Streptomyces sp. QH1-20]|uniref:hypothetical protein n=1 Tax=Streptomyces sp. QH1-20 TaxID=3240934 RepID=UPI0035171263
MPGRSRDTATSCWWSPTGIPRAGTRYVLPQVGAYDNAGLRLRFSAVSVDRTTTPHSLLVSEYAENGIMAYGDEFRGRPNRSKKPKVVRWPLVPGRSDRTGSLSATSAPAGPGADS